MDVGFGNAGSTSRCTTNPVSLADWSVNEMSTPPALELAATRFDGSRGGTCQMIGRIMSFSSCPRMWQCHTYSQPKLVGIESSVAAAPLLKGFRFEKFMVEPVTSL